MHMSPTTDNETPLSPATEVGMPQPTFGRLMSSLDTAPSFSQTSTGPTLSDAVVRRSAAPAVSRFFPLIAASSSDVPHGSNEGIGKSSVAHAATPFTPFDDRDGT